MFTREKSTKSTATAEEARDSGSTSAADTATLLAPATTTPSPTTSHTVSRHYSIPPAPTPLATAREAKSETRDETKRLTVGKGISLDGKISSCDRLIVDGKVEAELQDCHTVEITENGTFKGAAEIASAEISGNYEGSLTVRESLLIRSTGHVSGTVRYGKLHIEDGGELNGDVKSLASK
jgi:cytoskeletal protein CcmA (bactofilin family)